MAGVERRTETETRLPGVEKLDSRAEVAQHRRLVAFRQLRAWLFVGAAALVPASTAAAQDQARVVRGLAFVGNRALDDVTLSAAIATTNSSWFARHPPFRWFGLGWKVNSDLPDTDSFEAATRSVREEDVAAGLSCGPDVDKHVAAFKKFLADWEKVPKK